MKNRIRTAKMMVKARGQASFLKFQQGLRLTQKRSIEAYCYDCMGFYADGVADCENNKCPLHPYMPYRTLTKGEVLTDGMEDETTAINALE